MVGKERSKRGAVTLRFFEDDGSQCWLPVDDVQRWLEVGGNKDGKCTSTASDEYAAEALGLLKGVFNRTTARDADEGAGTPLELQSEKEGENENELEETDRGKGFTADGALGAIKGNLQRQAIRHSALPTSSISNTVAETQTASFQEDGFNVPQRFQGDVRFMAPTSRPVATVRVSADFAHKLNDPGPSRDTCGTGSGRVWTQETVPDHVTMDNAPIVGTSGVFTVTAERQLGLGNQRKVIDLTVPFENVVHCKNHIAQCSGISQLESSSTASRGQYLPSFLPGAEAAVVNTQAQGPPRLVDSFQNGRSQEFLPIGATMPATFAQEGMLKAGESLWHSPSGESQEVIYIDVDPPRKDEAPPLDVAGSAVNSNSKHCYQQGRSLHGNRVDSGSNWSIGTHAGPECNAAERGQVFYMYR